jgi:hypothetical protein
MAAKAAAGIGAGLPEGLALPVQVALARAVEVMPRSGTLPGLLLFEPKWDGYIHCTRSSCSF